MSFRDLLKDNRILIFTLTGVLFNISNAATLPLVGEILSEDKYGSSSAWQIAAAMFLAGIVMIAVAAFTGEKTDSWGLKPLFLAAFACLAIRNGVTVLSHQPSYLIGLQLFDGIAGANLWSAPHARSGGPGQGTGRFNFLQGSIQSAMGLGFISNLGFGFLAKAASFNANFLGLSAHWRSMYRRVILCADPPDGAAPC